MKITRDIRERFGSPDDLARFVAGVESGLRSVGGIACGRSPNAPPPPPEPAPATAVTGPEPESTPQ